MTTALIVAGLLAGLTATIGPLLLTIARNGGEAEHLGADEGYATELHDMAAYAAEVPTGLALPGPYRLADDWPQQLDVPTVPELPVPALIRRYVTEAPNGLPRRPGRHRQEATVDLTALRHQLGVGQTPPVGGIRLRAAVDDTEQMTAVWA